MSIHGWIALGLDAFFSLLICCGSIGCLDRGTRRELDRSVHGVPAGTRR